METVDELLDYGTYLEDIEYKDNKNNFMRYRLILLDNKLYSLYVRNGDVISLEKVGRI